jgi:hypothetical protein
LIWNLSVTVIKPQLHNCTRCRVVFYHIYKSKIFVLKIITLQLLIHIFST